MAKTIGGYVSADGKINSGDGFSVEHDSTNAKGVYYITFTQEFDDVPAVNVTIAKSDYSPGWWVNAIITELTESRCEIVLVEGDFKSKYDSDFTFIAHGNVG